MALPVRKGYNGAPANAVLTNNPGADVGTDTTFIVDTTTNWGAVPFFCVVDPGTSREEKVKVTAKSGVTLTVVRASDNTSAFSHSAGAAIYPVFTATEADEANQIASVMTTKGDIISTNGSSINRLAVGTNNHVLQADSSTTNGIKWGQIANGNIATGAITSDKILDGTIVAGDIATGAITSDKILDGTIVAGDLADGAVTSAKILDGTIVAGDLADNAVVVAKIADGAVTSAKILDGTIVTGDLADGAVSAAKLNTALPRGVVSYAKFTSSISSVGGSDVLAGTANDFTAVAGRTYRVTYFEPNIYGGAIASAAGKIKVGGTTVQQSNSYFGTLGYSGSVITTHYGTFTAGLVNNLTCTISVSASTATVGRTTTNYAYVIVEDMGIL